MQVQNKPYKVHCCVHRACNFRINTRQSIFVSNICTRVYYALAFISYRVIGKTTVRANFTLDLKEERVCVGRNDWDESVQTGVGRKC